MIDLTIDLKEIKDWGINNNLINRKQATITESEIVSDLTAEELIKLCDGN